MAWGRIIITYISFLGRGAPPPPSGAQRQEGPLFSDLFLPYEVKRRVATQEPEGIAASRPKRASKVPLRFGETSVAAAAKPAKSAPKPRGWKGYALVSESIKSNRPNDADVPCDTLESLDILPGRSAPFGVVGVVAGMVATMSVVQLPGHSRPLGVVGVGAGDGGDGSYQDVPLDTSKSVEQLPGPSRPLGVVGVGAGDGGDGIYKNAPWDTFKTVVLLPGHSGPLGVVGVGAGDGGDGSYQDVPWDTFKSVVLLPGHSRPLGVVGVGAGDGGMVSTKSVVLLPGHSRPLGVVGVGAGDGGMVSTKSYSGSGNGNGKGFGFRNDA
ncbi:hypothetical protein B0H11DRAFT_1910022 [Mycena galericulata]|nr:hypothetical protein B0H11DRAFT_1910022 [Mycena galericulata]